MFRIDEHLYLLALVRIATCAVFLQVSICLSKDELLWLTLFDSLNKIIFSFFFFLSSVENNCNKHGTLHIHHLVYKYFFKCTNLKVPFHSSA